MIEELVQKYVEELVLSEDIVRQLFYRLFDEYSGDIFEWEENQLKKELLKELKKL